MVHGRNQKAFTLLEVMLAMMVIASGLFILTNSWSGTYNRLRKTQIQVQMASLLERKVVELERDFKGKSLDSIPEEKEDDFGSDVPNFSWTMKSRKLEVPDLSSSLMAQSKGDGASEMLLTVMKAFTEHLSKSIKEVKVVVTYHDKKKPMTADVTFYVVDYDRPLPIPGGGGAPAGG
jgi:general secretion pathway protein I